MKRILAITALLLLAPTTHAQGTNTCQANNCPPVVTVNANPTGNVCVNAPQVTIYNGAAYGCVNGAMAITGGGGGGTTTNALTAGATGGAAPGTTFNGSAAVTFDYHSFGAQVNLSLIKGTLTDGDMCTYTASGTLLNCNTAVFNPASPGAIGGTTPAAGSFTVVYTGTEYSNGTCTTSTTITPVNGNRQKVTLTNGDACALTFTQPASGTVSITLKIIQSAVSTYNGTITGCKWPGGVVPTITATTGAVDFVSVYLDGSTAYCAASQNFQ